MVPKALFATHIPDRVRAESRWIAAVAPAAGALILNPADPCPSEPLVVTKIVPEAEVPPKNHHAERSPDESNQNILTPAASAVKRKKKKRRN